MNLRDHLIGGAIIVVAGTVAWLFVYGIWGGY
jgi:hypothetical protein